VVDARRPAVRHRPALAAPSTRYRDLALGPALFHWESQSNTTASSPTGQRTIHHATRGSRVFLFRYAEACGYVRAQATETGRPPHGVGESLWQLERKIPAAWLPGCWFLPVPKLPHLSGWEVIRALENLSKRLLPLLSDRFADSSHVRLIGLGGADDQVIWERARSEGALLVTATAACRTSTNPIAFPLSRLVARFGFWNRRP